MDIYDHKLAASNAVTVAPIVTEFVSAQTAVLVEKYTSLYKSGRLTPETALAGWAQITVLDNLVDELRNTIARAERAEAKERQRGEREGA
jgi:hypothetical protein